MGIIGSNKQVSVRQIDCEGSLQVTLSLTAAPDILTNPTDIVLVLDRSGSMAGEPLAAVKEGSDTFIDIIASSTGGDDTTIGSGSRMAVVSFAATATKDTPLTASVAELKTAVNALAARGTTNHADAFLKATELFDPASANARVIVLFTDGKTTAGPPAAPVAQAAKNLGITIYCIGLIGDDGISVADLNEWASDPDAAHVAVTPDAAALEALFEELAANISKTGATNIILREVVTPDFTITGIDPPLTGTVEQIAASTLQWRIPSLGKTQEETALLTFTIRHQTDTPGLKQVNQSITYSDTEGNLVSFPDPFVDVICTVEEEPDSCPEPVVFTMDGCQGTAAVDMGIVPLSGEGRMVETSLTIPGVCPGRPVALAVTLVEETPDGEKNRGMKTFLLPPHTAPTCRDVNVRCIRFILPEEGGSCTESTFALRGYAHYADTGFVCCEDQDPQ